MINYKSHCILQFGCFGSAAWYNGCTLTCERWKNESLGKCGHGILLDKVIWLDKWTFWLVLSSKLVSFLLHHLEKPHRNQMKNKIFPYNTKLNPPTWPQIHWHTNKSPYGDESNAKTPIKIGWEIEMFQKLGHDHF